MRLSLWWLLAALLSNSALCRAAVLTIAAASDLKFALDELGMAFRARHPEVVLKITYGSSGSFYAQFLNRAPFDLFFSADLEYPRKLVEAGLSLESNTFQYAVGQIVLWVPKQSPLFSSELGIQSLLAPTVNRVAIANPRHAPYGRAAVAAMKSLQVFDQVEPKLVLGENVAQAAQFMQTGGAEIGIISLSLALAPTMKAAGRYWEVPRGAYPRMDQGGVILRWAKEADGARAFRDFVLSEPGRDLLPKHGFTLPDAKGQ